MTGSQVADGRRIRSANTVVIVRDEVRAMLKVAKSRRDQVNELLKANERSS